MAIVKALSGDIKESLILFSKAYSKDYEFFSQIWVKLNISTCKLMLDDFNSCIEILNECDEQLKTTIRYIRGFVQGGILAVCTPQNYKWTFKYLLEHLFEEREWYKTQQKERK